MEDEQAFLSISHVCLLLLIRNSPNLANHNLLRKTMILKKERKKERKRNEKERKKEKLRFNDSFVPLSVHFIFRFHNMCFMLNDKFHANVL